MRTTKRLLMHVGGPLTIATLLVACGGSGGSGGAATFPPTAPTPVTTPPPPAPTPDPTPEPTPPAQAPENVTISGTVTFEDVPASPFTNGLDFDSMSDEPARGVTVQAVDASDNVLDTGQTSETGSYSLTVSSETPVRIRVIAELVQTAGTIWDVRVQNNVGVAAGMEPVYALEGSLTTSGVADSVRDLNADSGWDLATNAYTQERASAPFAILDPVYETLTEFAATAPGAIFPPVDFNWSTENISASGDRSMGMIGTSSYVSGGGVESGIFILGDANQDTDEFDEHVIVHEWGHYFEDQVSRSDSIGGGHALNDRLDLRLAFSEGFGNAIAAIGNDDPIYRDTSMPSNPQGFSFNIEGGFFISNRGWFNEASTQEIIYDIFDSADDGADTISLGLGPIFDAMTSDTYAANTSFTTIYTFAEAIRNASPTSSAAIDSLLSSQSIEGRGPTGFGETNNGGIATSLPVYKTVTIGGPPVVVCSVDDASDNFGSSDFNNLGTRDFIVFNNPIAGALTFRAQLISSDKPSVDPDFIVYNQGNAIIAGFDEPASFEEASGLVTAGDFSIEFYDFDNLDETLPNVDNPRDDGDSCYNFTITR